MEYKKLRAKVIEIQSMNYRQVHKFRDEVAVSLVDEKTKYFLMEAISIRLNNIARGHK